MGGGITLDRQKGGLLPNVKEGRQNGKEGQAHGFNVFLGTLDV